MTQVIKRFTVNMSSFFMEAKPITLSIEEVLKKLRNTNWVGVYELALFLGSQRFEPTATNLTPQAVNLDELPVQSEAIRHVPIRVGTITQFGIAQEEGKKHLYIDVDVTGHEELFKGDMKLFVGSVSAGIAPIPADDSWQYLVRFDRPDLPNNIAGNCDVLFCHDPALIDKKITQEQT